LSCGYDRIQILGYSPQTIFSIARFASSKILQSSGNGGIKISERPVYLFAKRTMAHPFSDGNGRFVRMPFASALARQLSLQLPRVAFARVILLLRREGFESDVRAVGKRRLTTADVDTR